MEHSTKENSREDNLPSKTGVVDNKKPTRKGKHPQSPKTEPTLNIAKDGEERQYGKHVCTRTSLPVSYTIAIRYVRTINCRVDQDSSLPKLSSVSWIDDNTFVVADETNEKIKKYDKEGKCIMTIPVKNILSVTCKEDYVYCGLKCGKILTIVNDKCIDTNSTLRSRVCPPVVINENVIAVGSDNIFTIACPGTNVTAASISKVPIVDKTGSQMKLRSFFPQEIKNNIVVSDWNSKKVYLIKNDGKVSRAYRRVDRGDDWVPGGIACDNMDNIYIADYMRRDVTVINAYLEYLDTIKLQSVKCPRCLDCSTSNKLLVTCDKGVALFDILYVFNQPNIK